MDELISNKHRFVGATSQVISFTKWHDLKTGEFWFDIYVNGKVDGRYDFSGATKRFQELMMEV